jgi:hypothetical protein
MMIKPLVLFLGLLFALFAGTHWAAAWASELGILEGEEVVIHYDRGLEKGAEEVLRIYPQIKNDLEKTLKRQLASAPAILLLKEETFSRAADNPHIVAFAVPDRNLIVIDHSKMSIDPFTVELTLKHELCHILLHESARGGRIPKWLDEGIAQWVSAGIAEILINPKRSLLNEAVISGKSLNLRVLADAFPRDKESLHLAYEASKSFVAYLIERFGIDAITGTGISGTGNTGTGNTGILDHIEKGEDWEIAISKAVSHSFHELEKEWHEDLKRKLTWYTYVINNLYEILFFLAAIIAIIGFVRAFMRKRAYMRQDDAEHSSDEA